jgi:ribosomal protein L23
MGRQRRTCRARRRKGQRSVWSVAIVMFHEDVEDPLKMLLVQDQQPVETL